MPVMVTVNVSGPSASAVNSSPALNQPELLETSQARTSALSHDETIRKPDARCALAGFAQDWPATSAVPGCLHVLLWLLLTCGGHDLRFVHAFVP